MLSVNVEWCWPATEGAILATVEEHLAPGHPQDTLKEQTFELPYQLDNQQQCTYRQYTQDAVRIIENLLVSLHITSVPDTTTTYNDRNINWIEIGSGEIPKVP
jgi:hypothetical protein